MGGHDQQDYVNDVWVSDEGKNWTKLTEHAGWSKRDAYGAIVYKGKIWVMGGHDGTSGPNQWHNDVWSSEDGVNWTLITPQAAWHKREAFGLFVLNGKMVLMGGWAGEQNNFNDLWESEDGVNWTQAVKNSPWSPRCWAPSTMLEDGRVV